MVKKMKGGEGKGREEKKKKNGLLEAEAKGWRQSLDWLRHPGYGKPFCRVYVSTLHKSPSYFLWYSRGEGPSSTEPSYPELEVWVGEVLISFLVGGLPRLLEPFREQKAALLVSGQKTGTCRMSPRKLPTTR